MARERSRAGQGPAPFGILLIDKPAGPTSHDVVGWVRWALRERSVGHCGTLDPAATGLLVVCVGAATKLVEYLTGVDKRYLARFVLGRSTTTADAEGETLLSQPVGPDDIERAANELVGLLDVTELPPPAYSAIKIDGQRAHALARAGEAPELPPRPMAVHQLELLGRGDDWLEADLSVAKGTYVRSLAEELGRRAGLPVHLGALRRLAAGALGLHHPHAVTGLVAERLEPRPGGEHQAPRWRVGLGPSWASEAPASGPPLDPRAAAEQALRARLLAPWTCLPFPTAVLGPAPEVPEADAPGPLLDRLVQGQRLRDSPGIRAILGLEPPGASEHHALVDRAGGRMILLRRDRGEERLAPIRVLRFDPNETSDH